MAGALMHCGMAALRQRSLTLTLSSVRMEKSLSIRRYTVQLSDVIPALAELRLLCRCCRELTYGYEHLSIAKD